MVLLNFNWFKWNAEQFASRLDETILPIHYVVFQMLIEQKFKFEADARTSENPLDDSDMQSYLDWLNEEFRVRRCALATMIFTLIAREITLHIDTVTAALNRAFPSTTPPSRKFPKQVAEYKARFAIDMTRGPYFQSLQEIILARNDAIHAENAAKEYLTQTNRRLIDEAGQVTLTPELLQQIATETKAFVNWLADVVTELWKQKCQV